MQEYKKYFLQKHNIHNNRNMTKEGEKNEKY